MKDIEVLMMDGCTKAEAEKHLQKGAPVFDDFEEKFDSYMNEWGIEDDEKEMYRKMISTKSPIEDWGIVEDGDKTYYIMYCM